MRLEFIAAVGACEKSTLVGLAIQVDQVSVVQFACCENHFKSLYGSIEGPAGARRIPSYRCSCRAVSSYILEGWLSASRYHSIVSRTASPSFSLGRHESRVLARSESMP